MLTADRLREVLDYDPTTGVFTWRATLSSRAVAGSEAGSADGHGYRRIRVDRVEYRAHRLAWVHVTGVWPTLQVDHINGKKSDNRWSNLREATQSQNNANTRARNMLGVKGVRRASRGSRYIAEINHEGRCIYLGCYRTPEEASLVYKAAAKGIHGAFARVA